MKTNQKDRRFGISFATLALLLVPLACYGTESDYYTEGQIYGSRPDPNREMPLGHVGATGVVVRIYQDVTVKVEATMPGSPADGKFKKGETITGINGVSLKGKNPFVTLGSALTDAEATDGQMIFDVASGGYNCPMNSGAGTRSTTMTAGGKGAALRSVSASTRGAMCPLRITQTGARASSS
jgi:hypothetical protein